MTQADLVRLLFAKGDEGFYWKYCFNEQCPLANECARQLSVVYKNADKTDGYAVFPDAYKNGKCEHFMQIHLVKMAYGLEKMLDELRKKDVKVFKSSMISYFGSRTSYYRYKLGQTPLYSSAASDVYKRQQYILQWCKDQGYENMVFDRYTEELDY